MKESMANEPPVPVHGRCILRMCLHKALRDDEEFAEWKERKEARVRQAACAKARRWLGKSNFEEGPER